MSWAEEKMEQLETKGKANWTDDDYEAYHYCQECFAEDERDAEYLGSSWILSDADADDFDDIEDFF